MPTPWLSLHQTFRTMQSSFKWFKGSSYKNCDLKQFLAAAGSNYLPQVHINRAILIPSSTIGVQHLAELGLRQNQRARLIDYSPAATSRIRSEEHTSELQSQSNLVCRLLLEKKKKK